MRGIQLAVHFSFLLLLGYVAYEGWRAAGWAGLVWMSATLLAFFTCVVLHELGHSIVAQRRGVRVSRILLLPIGGMAEFERIPRRPRDELAITLAGPAVNFAISALIYLFFAVPPNWVLAEYPVNLADLAQLLFYANLVMGCFNLLPVFPMDGGRVLRAILASRMSYLRATQIAAGVGKLLAVAGMIAMVVWLENYLGAALFVFIFLVGEVELRSVLNREREAEYWRAAMARLQARAAESASG